MSKNRDTRRLAMQVLYQADTTGEADRETILAGLDDEHDPAEVREAATDLALAAWASHADADAAIAALTPEWPTHRQPPVDRAILRLAHHEMVTGRTPPKVAINEAVELSKHYASEHSPPFINGVLDKLARTITVTTPAPQTEADWLDDALDTPAE